MIKPKISVKVVLDSKVVKSLSSRKSRKIFHFLKVNKFQNCSFDLRVTYRSGGNEGVYFSEKDLFEALDAFLDIDC